MEALESAAVGTSGALPRKKGTNSSEKVSAERAGEGAGVGVNEGLDPVTCGAWSRSVMQCVPGLQPLC